MVLVKAFERMVQPRWRLRWGRPVAQDRFWERSWRSITTLRPGSGAPWYYRGEKFTAQRIPVWRKTG